MKRICVFDHLGTSAKNGPLERLAVAAKLEVLTKTSAHVPEKNAVGDLLATGATVLFVHMEPTAWECLGGRRSSIKCAVRFSTDPLPATRRRNLERGLLNCSKPLGSDGITQEEFDALTEVCREPELLEELLEGRIPPKVRRLIVLAEPHRLRALYILLQGVVAAWASDPGHDNCAEARKVSGLSAVPRMAPMGIDLRRTFWECLGIDTDETAPKKDPKKTPRASAEGLKEFREALAVELGMVEFPDIRDSDKKEAGVPDQELRELVALVDAICCGAGEEALSRKVVLGAFEWLKGELDR